MAISSPEVSTSGMSVDGNFAHFRAFVALIIESNVPLQSSSNMQICLSRSTSLLAAIVTLILFHTQLAFAAGSCDLPMFAGARLFGTGVGSQYMVTGDFNHDGFPDLAVSSASAVLVLLGNGDGTFQPAVSYTLSQPKDLAVGDFNGDGKLDLAVNASFSTVVLLGNGDGTFKP